MQKFIDTLEKWMMPVSNWCSNNRYIKAIASGMVATMPFTLIAAVFSIIANIPGYLPFLPAWSDNAYNILIAPYNLLFGLLSVLISFTVAYNHAKHYDLHMINCGLISVVTFFLIAAPYESDFFKGSSFDGKYLGYAGIFTAVLVGIFSVELYRLLLKGGMNIKLPGQMPPMVKDSFEAIIPFSVILSVFYALNLGIIALTGNSLPGAIQALVTPMITASDSFGFVVITGILGSFFFWLGMHGWSIVQAPLMAFTMAKLAEQSAAYAAGQPLPYIAVGGWAFTPFNWLFPVLLLVLCKAKRNRAVGKLALIPSLFSISEPYTFGTPIVLNPILAIPFIFGGILNSGVCYIAISLGLMNRAFAAEIPTLPTPINTFLTNGDWRSFLWFIVVAALMTALWYPFLKVWDKQCLREEAEQAKLLVEEEAEKA